ncbi:MAG: SpoIIE family protein phosphatase [Actinomycetales bacterium]
MRHVEELTLDASPDAVPRARRLVRERTDLPAGARDDAELVIAELTSNACLHGHPPVNVRIRAIPHGVRLEVSDAGEGVPVRPRENVEAMTGRGFTLVTALCQRWGVDPLPGGGKTVWAELDDVSPGRDLASGAPDNADHTKHLDTIEHQDNVERLLLAWADDAAPADAAAFGSDGLHTVRLGAVPTELLLEAKSHIDDVVRELKLVSGAAVSDGERLSPALQALVQAVTEDFAVARTEIKRQALEAAHHGEGVTRLTLRLPLSAAEAGQRYLDALDEIDRQSRAGRMLTMAPRPSHRAFRRWYLTALIDQLHALARGETAPPPPPFPQVLAAQVDELAELVDAQTRLQLLQTLARGLAEARTPQQMADLVADAVYGHEGVVSARVLLLTSDTALTSLAYRGDPVAAHFTEISLQGALPAAHVARTGHPLHARSMADLYEDLPALERVDIPLSERAMHIVPLRVADRLLGVLAVAFRAGVIDFEAQRGFVTAIADGLAQAIERALAEDRVEADRVARELAVKAAGVGTYIWDLVTGQLAWDDELVALFGLDRSEQPQAIEDFWKFVHPADAERVRAVLERAIEERGDFETEYRSELLDGTRHWYTARGRVVLGHDGTPVRMIGAVQDTTARRDSETRVARAMDSLSTAFFFLDRDWHFTFLNSEAERVLGRSREELLGRNVWEEFPLAVGTDFETHYRRAAATGDPVAFDAYYPEPLNAWYEIRAWPSPDGLSVYFLDVTDRRRAQDLAQQAIDRAGLLARVSEALARTLDPQEAMEALARIVVPGLADWCVVTLVGDDRHAGTRRGLGEAWGWHRDEARRPAAQRYAQIRLDAMTEAGLVVRAVEDGEGQVVQGASMDVLRHMFDGDSEPLRLLEELDTWAIAVLPLVGQEQSVGLLSLVNSRERGAFTDEELGLLRDIAARAGLVLDRARLYRQQRRVAEGLQRSLLRPPAASAGVSVGVRYVPAAEVAQVGGDWYDTFCLDDRTLLVIGDVMGHDLMAAAAMGEARTLIRTLAAQDRGPARTLDDAESVMASLGVDTLATVLVGCLEPAPATSGTAGAPGRPLRFRFSNAGHPPPLVLSPTGAVRVLDSDHVSPLLGAGARGSHVEQVEELETGSTLILYTDGLVERRGQSIDEGLSRLAEVVATIGDLDVDAACDVILQLLPERPDDDVALLVVRV